MGATWTRALCAIVVIGSVVGCGGARARTTAAVEIERAPSASVAPSAPHEASEPAPGDIGAQLDVRASEHAPDMVPGSSLHRGSLQQGDDERFETVLEAGRCYRVVGVGGAEMSDLDLFLIDENGSPIAEDTGADRFAVLGHGSEPICPRWTGPFTIRALAASGSGEYALQLFRSP